MSVLKSTVLSRRPLNWVVRRWNVWKLSLRLNSKTV